MCFEAARVQAIAVKNECHFHLVSINCISLSYTIVKQFDTFWVLQSPDTGATLTVAEAAAASDGEPSYLLIKVHGTGRSHSDPGAHGHCSTPLQGLS